MRSQQPRFVGTLASTVLIALISTPLPAAKPPQNVAHLCSAVVADRAGDAITSDGGGAYTTDGDVHVSLWDMNNGVADHLYLQASGARTLSISIPEITGGTQVCGSGVLQPNVNASGYQFYNLLPVGSSTSDVGQNFGGTFRCSFGSGGRDAYNVTYESQCIVITRGDYGNPASDPKKWTVTADPGCTAGVTKILNRKVVGQWVGQDVPFQVTAVELP